ncbi:BamA/TamA family outer membrane protein [Sphingomonas sp. KRR8]|uniref:autotransporter assembly complex protein TamA n=1 Tax=Sphingomonas sp. KRR8 TaxID=2942996 RepID=UPI00202197CC|nr:BamA/TamA family outer membrane protein [Sphingomonas sp. KRR8]URD62064.1 BamA/TamA family outer membrane protein [Sphingomonas sp. KRR8]
MGRWGVGIAALAAGLASAPVTAAQGVPQAQPPQPAPAPPPSAGAAIDPSAPLDPMPDLGVAWPDLGKPDAPVPGQPAPVAVTAPAPSRADQLAEERRYAWSITGLGEGEDDKALLRRFRESSALEGDRNKQANAAQLDRRARADAELLTQLLRSTGHYDAAVEPSVEAVGDTVRITLAASPGARYRFEAVDLPGLEAAGPDAEALRNAFAVKAGDPVDAQKVIDAGLALQVALGRLGFARAKVGEQDVVVDHQTQLARLVLPVATGEFQRFGAIRVSGKPDFGARHVSAIARFEAGDRYRQDRVDDLRRALIATGLVGAADVQLVPLPDGKTVDLAVRLEPAPVHTIAGELGYGTGEGVRAEASWQHRNFINPEGALTVQAVVGTQEQSAGTTLRFNNWRRRDRVLTFVGNASHLDRPGYEARTVQIGATVERQSNFLWRKTWTWSLGSELLASDERDVDLSRNLPRRRTFFIAALPASLTWDQSNDLLDPTKGFRLGGRVSPEASLQGSAFGYVRTQVDASAYHPFGERVVAAGRIRLGTIVGASRDRIAPSRRFYAGGGGSVRGYGYQQLGPRDANGDPIGGRSLAEFSLEARVRLGSFGVVPFFDGGTLSTSSLPKLSGWQYGAGLGLRYYSSFGPIRIDVGTPLNRRPGDSRIAVTVSLGQAF